MTGSDPSRLEDIGLRRQLDRYAIDCLQARSLSTGELPQDVHARDLWVGSGFGAVLFFLAERSDGRDAVAPTFATVCMREVSSTWALLTTGGLSVEPVVLADSPDGFQQLGTVGSGQLRVTIGLAGSSVSKLRVRSAVGESDRPLGARGSFVHGITHDDPVTYLHAVDGRGRELPVSILL